MTSNKFPRLFGEKIYIFNKRYRRKRCANEEYAIYELLEFTLRNFLFVYLGVLLIGMLISYRQRYKYLQVLN